MDDYLLHPSHKTLRDELKDEYRHMLADIEQYLEEQQIEEQKQSHSKQIYL